jgi:hypothetical protein
MALIGISGKSGSGKDLFAKIFIEFMAKRLDGIHEEWVVKKFAYKVKEVVCILLGCTMEQLEDSEFKKQRLSEEWDILAPYGSPVNGLYTEQEYNAILNSGDISDNVFKVIKPVDYTYRTAMTTIGTDLIRYGFHPNAWVNALMNDYKLVSQQLIALDMSGKNPTIPLSDKVVTEYPNWLITDVRFKNEAEAVRKNGGWLIRIDRPDYDNGLTDLQKKHESEVDLDGYSLFQYHIVNDGNLDSFMKAIRNFATHYSEIQKIKSNFGD